MQHRTYRYPTQFPIELRTPAGPTKGKVINVNSTGAHLEGIGPVRRGDKVQIGLMYDRVEGIVQWASNNRAGIVFRPHITEDQVDMLRYRRDGRAANRHGTVGFTYAEMR
jgi:hypothetical protein